MISKEKQKAMEAVGTLIPEPFNLDGILGELGSFGRYQLLLLLLLAFRDSFLVMCNLNYLFTAYDVAHRCIVPECEQQTNASWHHWALSPEAGACSRPAPLDAANATCQPHAFDPHHHVPCQVVYDDYNSLVAEFDIGCEPWKRTLVGTVHNLGLVFSFVFFGFISDRYGRKVVIVGSPLLVGVFGLAKSFAPNYWLLLTFEFLEAALGYGNASLVLSLETVSHKRRVVFSCVLDILSSIGGAFLGLIAWRVPYWRLLVRAIYAPLLAVVGYIWHVDEGVRWLVARGKQAEAARVLRKVARTNNVTLSARALNMLAGIAEQRAEPLDSPLPLPLPPSPPTACIGLTVLRSRVMAWRMVLIAGCFFCASLLYNGLLVMSAGVSGDRYVNFSVLILSTVPTRVITAVTLTRFGRKAPIHVAYLVCALFIVTSAFVPDIGSAIGGSASASWSWVSVCLYVGGMACSSYGNFAVSVAALEVFPTTARNSLTNLAYTLGRLGGVLAPQLPLLQKYMRELPSLVFGGVALLVALLALLLPDGSKVALPDDLAAAERVDTDANAPQDNGKDTPVSARPDVALQDTPVSA